MSLVNEHKYDDIINLPHHVSPRHPQMPPADRAAQFSPFAALTGHEAAIRETARLTDQFVELDEDRKEELDEQLRLIRENQSLQPEVEITYFRPDPKKEGGAYLTVCGKVKKVDEYDRRIYFMNGVAVPLENLYSIGKPVFHPGTLGD